jgi:hypothetical protein
MMSIGSKGTLFNIGFPETWPLSTERVHDETLHCPFTGRYSVGRPVVSGSPGADGHPPDGRMCLFSRSRT